jgi:hypothetical protein
MGLRRRLMNTEGYENLDSILADLKGVYDR